MPAHFKFSSRALFLTATLLSVLFPFAAYSNEEAVACVQQQLTEAGIDVGPLDGLMGGKTRAGYQTYIQREQLDIDVALSVPNAQTVCRKIGLHDEKAKQYWPSSISRLDFLISSTVPERVGGFLETLVVSMDKRISIDFGIERAGLDRIIVGTNPSEIKKLSRPYLKVAINDFDQVLRDICGSFRNISGHTFSGLMFVCVNPNEKLGENIGIDWTRFFIVHELYHLYEFELTGLALPNETLDVALSKEGPVWIQEGVAQALANSIVTNATHAEYRDIMLKKLKNNLPDLNELERRDVLKKNRSLVYRGGAVAATKLLEEFGPAAIGQYLEGLSKQSSWDVVFEDVFGQAPDEFYDSLK